MLFSLVLFSCIFTAYFVGCVAFETYADMKDEPRGNNLKFALKVVRKFWSNFTYHLP